MSIDLHLDEWMKSTLYVRGYIQYRWITTVICTFTNMTVVVALYPLHSTWGIILALRDRRMIYRLYADTEGRSIGCVLRDKEMIYRLCAERHVWFIGCDLSDRGTIYRLCWKRRTIYRLRAETEGWSIGYPERQWGNLKAVFERQRDNL